MSPLLPLLLALFGAFGPTPADPFPHERHARLFPLCEGCHQGIEQAGAPVYPDAASCVRCHDGKRKAEVSWSAPAPGRSSLRFTHERHAAASPRTVACGSCHNTGDGGRMSVGRPAPAACFACHGGAAHLEGGERCQQCHVPLTSTAWDASRIAALPRPAKHEDRTWASAHGSDANGSGGSCATCHARESCERCHLNAARIPAIAKLEKDVRVAALLRGKPGSYAAPASHTNEWEWRHGASAVRDAASCANCHARTSCTVCHARASEATDGMPAAQEDGPQGVRYARARSVHAPGWEREHGARAGADGSCLGCHERSTCDGCHASRRTQFHAPNFAARHGPEAYGSDLQCTSCHSTEVFCRSCHANTGRAAEGRGGVAFHNSAPLWLLGHGQAARQSLEGCASCHKQSDCARCHSTLGGWGVNPHGTGFNAARLQQQNRLTCLRCHRSGSVTGS